MEYMPSSKEIQLFREFYKKHYDEKCIDLFDKASKLNSVTIEKSQIKKRTELIEMFKMIEEYKEYNTYIWLWEVWCENE